MILLRSYPALSGLGSTSWLVLSQAKLQYILMFGQFTSLTMVLIDTCDVRVSSLG